MADFPVGFGRYQLIERLAMGGMAELYVATSPGEHGFQKKVVIKRLLPHLLGDDTYTAMFIDEAKLTAKLVHPKIAQTFELGRVDDALFIAMEYVEGIDVLALLREYAQRRKKLPPPIAAWIAHEVLDALDYAHNLVDDLGRPFGIVHRDISPSNVLLSVRGHVKLVDFGIARAKDPDRAHKSKTGTLKGKYGYMSPEQVIELPLDQRSDLFSVGVVLAEMLTGRRLFAAANELDVLLMVRDAKLTRFDKYGSELEHGLQGIVRKALKKSVDERWQNAGAFRDAIAEWLFEQRHRMTNKDIAPIVGELQQAVQERRGRSENQTAIVDDVGLPPARPPSDDGVPQISIEPNDEVSMPVISVTYEAGQSRPASSPPLSPAELANSQPPSNKRADTVRERPVVHIPPKLGRPEPPQRAPFGSTPPEDSSQNSGAVEVPIADSISAAVEAIVLPDVPAQIHAALPRDEDSQMRAFDDITEEPVQTRSRDLAMPSPEELARKKPPTPPLLADIAEDPDDAGDFSLTSPLRVLFRLMTARATGLLVVAVGGIKKEIYVRDGQPEYVSSNVASELFGNYLVTKGVLSDGELAMALAMMPHYGGKLGDTLVGLGLLKPLEVFRHLTRQVRTKIIDVCTWNKGGFAWYQGRENPREAFPLDFNAFEILGAGAMALSDDVTDSWVAKNGGLKLRAVRSRRVGPERFEVNGLVELAEQLDGKTSVGDLVEAQPERELQLKTGRMLCLLEACDLARTI
ncbi:MAG TPA: protein kinase [Kofleriaceae bacterium]|nr:protein kinase [Kofleriaceae bacterium]